MCALFWIWCAGNRVWCAHFGLWCAGNRNWCALFELWCAENRDGVRFSNFGVRAAFSVRISPPRVCAVPAIPLNPLSVSPHTSSMISTKKHSIQKEDAVYQLLLWYACCPARKIDTFNGYELCWENECPRLCCIRLNR